MSKVSSREWTVLVYQGNGCQAKFGTHQEDLLELQKLPPSDRVTFVAQSHEDYKNDVLLRRQIKPSIERSVVSGPVDTVKGRQNQSKQLADFVKWGLKKYPSERTCLVISGNAGGPNGIVADEKDGLTPLTEIKKGLIDGLEGKELDVLAFDGNWMACIEAASEFADTADLMVASQGKMDSWDYEKMFSELVNDPESDTDALASQMVAADHGKSGMSVHWLSEVPNALFWLNTLLDEARIGGLGRESLKKAQDVYHFKDLLSFVDRLRKKRSKNALGEMAEEAEGAIDDIVLEHGKLLGSDTGGINVATCYGDSKEGRAFRASTRWDQFLKDTNRSARPKRARRRTSVPENTANAGRP